MKTKDHKQNEGILLPGYLDDWIPSGHLCRFVNDTINIIDIQCIENEYKDGGQWPYDPRAMLKVWIYGYFTKVRTGRPLERSIYENICFRWLMGNVQPDYRTLNMFRSVRLKDHMKNIFIQIAQEAIKKGMIEIEQLAVDGTKLAADANKYKLIWKKNVERHKMNVEKYLKECYEEYQKLQEQEDAEKGNESDAALGKEISSEEIKKSSQTAAQNINETNAEANKKAKEKQNEARAKKTLEKKIKTLEQRKVAYEGMEELLGERNSFSKTDTDATGLRMKSDELRPGYNINIAAENEFIVDYTVTPHANDGKDLKGLLNTIKEDYKKTAGMVTADGAYGNEENYAYCEKENIIANIKPVSLTQEKKAEAGKTPYSKYNFKYEEEKDIIICPAGKELKFVEEKKEELEDYIRTIKTYQCSECMNCEHKTECVKSGNSRTVQRSAELDRLREKAKIQIKSEGGKKVLRMRGFNIETPFGAMKHNHSFTRFVLRGSAKVSTEIGLFFSGYNLAKMWRNLKN